MTERKLISRDAAESVLYQLASEKLAEAVQEMRKWITLADEEIAKVMVNLEEDSMDYGDLLHARRDLVAAFNILPSHKATGPQAAPKIENAQPGATGEGS